MYKEPTLYQSGLQMAANCQNQGSPKPENKAMSEANEGNEFRTQDNASGTNSAIEQNLDRGATANNFKRYFESHKSNFQDTALDVINISDYVERGWWGYHGRIKEGKKIKIDDGNIQLNIDELVFRPQSDQSQAPFTLAKKQHIVIINFETDDETQYLQHIRIKYFYYLCDKLKNNPCNWEIFIQDAPSPYATRNPSARDRRMLKIIFGYDRTGTSGTSDKDFQKWIGLFDEVYKFLAENRPKPEDLNTIPTPDYMTYESIYGSLDSLTKKQINSSSFIINFGELKSILNKNGNPTKYLGDHFIELDEARFNNEILEYTLWEDKAKKCKSFGSLRPALAIKLHNEGLANSSLLNSLTSDSQNARKYQLEGETKPISLATYTDTPTVIDNLLDFFSNPNYGCTADPYKLEIIVQFSKKKEQWDNLKKDIPELYEFFKEKMQQGKENQDSKGTSNDAGGGSFPFNRIFAGAPGTGKSHDLNLQAQSKFAGNTMRVTFHPEYTYYDFVGTYRPKMALVEENGIKMRSIEYAFVPGPFAKMLKKALWDRDNEYCLIIEEINRANMAAVFGDVFQLLDRLENGESEYAICPSEELYEYLMEKKEGGKPMKGQQPNEDIRNELRMPGNLYLWATMNSADQGVFPMDTAFKRRWSFKNMDIDPSQESIDDWDKIRRGINDMLLTHHVQEDKLMGYYFLKDRERADLATALKEKVMLYLFEDAAKPFRKNVFKASMNTCAKLRQGLDRNAPDLGVFQSEVWDGNPKSKDELPNTGVSIAGEQANEAQS